MSWKGFWKKFWSGTKIVAPIAAGLIPGGSVAATIARLVSAAVVKAEEEFPAQGTGDQKLEYVTVEVLDGLEQATGKNYNNPDTRALIEQVTKAEVAIRNAQQLYGETIIALHQAVDSVKDPAIPDAPEE